MKTWVFSALLLLANAFAQPAVNAVNNVQLCDSAAYAAAPDVEMNRCIQAAMATTNRIGTGGGVCDCRGASSNQVVSTAAPVVIGSNTKQVTLLLDNSGYIGANFTAPDRCAFEQHNGSALRFDSIGNVLGGNGGRITINKGHTLDALFCNKDIGPGNNAFTFVEGGTWYGNNDARLGSAIFHLRDVNAVSVFENIQTFICGTHTPHALLIEPGNGGQNDDVAFLNDEFDCSNSSSGSVVFLRGDSLGTISFAGGAIQHAGDGQSLLQVDGLGGRNNNNIAVHCGVQFETTGVAGDAISIRDSNSVRICADTVSGPAGANLVDISESARGLTHDVELGVQTYSGWKTAIHNNIPNSQPSVACGPGGCSVMRWQLRSENYLDHVSLLEQGTVQLSKGSAKINFKRDFAGQPLIFCTDTDPIASPCNANRITRDGAELKGSGDHVVQWIAFGN